MQALAVAGLSVVGRDRYGVFPLRGKLRNAPGPNRDSEGGGISSRRGRRRRFQKDTCANLEAYGVFQPVR